MTFVLVLLFAASNTAGFTSSMESLPGYASKTACMTAGKAWVGSDISRSFTCIPGPTK